MKLLFPVIIVLALLVGGIAFAAGEFKGHDPQEPGVSIQPVAPVTEDRSVALTSVPQIKEELSSWAGEILSTLAESESLKELHEELSAAETLEEFIDELKDSETLQQLHEEQTESQESDDTEEAEEEAVAIQTEVKDNGPLNLQTGIDAIDRAIDRINTSSLPEERKREFTDRLETVVDWLEGLHSPNSSGPASTPEESKASDLPKPTQRERIDDAFDKLEDLHPAVNDALNKLRDKLPELPDR